MSELHTFGFTFKLSFGTESAKEEIVFNEVSGILMEWDKNEISEGENKIFPHRLSTSVKYSNLILKRGMAAKESNIVAWCKQVFSDQEGSIKMKNIVLKLLDAEGKLLKSWFFKNAYPVAWAISEIVPANNYLAIENMELAYSSFQ